MSGKSKRRIKPPRPACGATTRTGGTCRKKATGNGRCENHGAGSPGPPAKDARRSTSMITLRDAYHAASAARDLTDPREAIAVLDAVVARLFRLVEERDTPGFRMRALDLKRSMDRFLAAAGVSRREADDAVARQENALRRADALRQAGDTVGAEVARMEADRAGREADIAMGQAKDSTKKANEANRELLELLERGASEVEAIEKLRIAADTLSQRVHELQRLQLHASRVLTEAEMAGMMSRVMDVIYEECGAVESTRIATRVLNEVLGGAREVEAAINDAPLLESPTARA